MKSFQIVFLIFILLIGFIHAGDNYKNHPGYVDFSHIDVPADDVEMNEISVSNIKGLFGGDRDGDDPLSLNVKTFEVDEENSEKIRKQMLKIEKKMQKDNWKPIVKVKNDDEYTNISLKYDKKTQTYAGLVIMTLESGHEAVFVNIIGSVSADALDDLDIDLDEEDFEKLKESIKHNDH